MARNFFTGGLMPSWDLPTQIESSLVLRDRWAVNGQHYARTCNAWLANLDHHRELILKIFESGEDPTKPVVALNRWRMFFMACEELFAANDGREWYVGHYLMAPRS